MSGAADRQGLPRDRAVAPLLSLEDDRFGTAATARHLATRVPKAELMILPRGGHVWLSAEAQVFGWIDQFLKRIGIKR